MHSPPLIEQVKPFTPYLTILANEVTLSSNAQEQSHSTASLLIMNSGRVDVHSKNLTLNTTSSVARATKKNNSGEYQFSDDGSDHFTASGLAISGDGIFATAPHTNLTINVNSLTDKVVKRDDSSFGWKAGEVNVLYDRESSSTQEGLVTEENYKDYIVERSRDMPNMETMNTEGIGLSIISRNSSAGGYAYLNGNTSINVNGTGASTGILVDGYYEAPQVASISNAIIDTKHLPVIQKPALTLSGNTTINVESTHDRAIGILALGTNSKYMEIPGDTHIEEEWDYKEEFVQINQFAHDVLSKGNLTIQAKGINGSDSYGIYVQSGARVDLLGKTTIDAPQAFGGGGVIFAYGDVILEGDTRIDGMLEEVYRNGVDVENNQNYKNNREAGAFIQYGGTLNIQSEKNGWFSGELNISAPHARINVDRLTLDENQNSGKVQIDYGGTLFVSDYFSSQGRNNLNISDNGRLIVTEKALLQNVSGDKPLVQSENWNRIDNLSIKESGIIQIIDVSKAEYTREDLDVIREKLFPGNEKKGIIELVGKDVHIKDLDLSKGSVSLDDLEDHMAPQSSNQRALLLASDAESATIIDFTTDQLKQTTLTGVKNMMAASVKNVVIKGNGEKLVVGGGTMVLNGNGTNEALVQNESGELAGVNVRKGSALVLGNLDNANKGTVEYLKATNQSGDSGSGASISILGKSNENRSSFTVNTYIQAMNGGNPDEKHQVTLINSDVTVNDYGKFDSLTLKDSSLVIGTTLNLKGTEGFASKIAGTVTASELTGEGTAYIGDKTSSGSVSVKKLSSTGLLFLDPLWTGNETWGDGSWLVASELAGDNSDELQTKLIVGMNSSVVLGTDKETALTEAKNLGLTYGEGQIESVVYIAKPIQVADTGMLYVDGSLTDVSDVQLSDASTYEAGSVVLSGNTLSMYDVSSSNGTAMVTAKKLTVDSAARLGIINATVSSDPIVLFNVDELVKTDDQGNTDFDLSNIFVTSDLMLEIKPVWDEATKTLSFTTVKHESATTRFPGLWTDSFMDQLYKTSSNNTNSSDKSIALLSRTASFADYGFSSIEQAVQATNEMTVLAVTSGVYNTAIDAGKLMNSSVEQRLSLTQTPDWSQGLNLWVDANGTTNQAKTLYGASGYELDLAGLVFGADTEVASSTRVGVAVTLGTGTGHSKNAVVRTKNSADFSGISLYGAKRIGAFNAQADLGYMHTKSDITRANAYGLNFDDDVKTNAITVGVRGEYQIPMGQFDVVPHVGLRWTHLRVGDYSAGFKTNSERLNVVTMPVGVGVRGSFNASSWSLSPNVDVTVNPALGSKKASSRVHCGNLTENIRTHVIDTAPVQMSLGLNAQNGAWTVGASWDLNVGSRDRLDNSIKLKARYVF